MRVHREVVRGPLFTMPVLARPGENGIALLGLLNRLLKNACQADASGV
jgi:hypothetical protein